MIFGARKSPELGAAGIRTDGDRMATRKLRSYGAAKSEIGLSARREQGSRKNNRAENSRQPTRRRERKMQRFKSWDQLSASCPFMPPSKTLLTSSAISHPAARSASSERNLSGRGEPPPRPESELALQIFARPNLVRVTRPREPVGKSVTNGFSSELSSGVEPCVTRIRSIKARSAAGTCRWPE
jgi:hypothetical protein